MSNTVILCVGAHPDDIEIGMGGTVAKLAAAGQKVWMVDLTNGEPTPQGSPEMRLAESLESARTLGAAGRKTLDMPNRYLEDTIDNRKKLAAVIREIRPDYLFSPYPDDAHPDHIAAGHLVESARFYAKLTKSDIPGEPFFPLRTIYYFPVHIRLRKEPSYLIDIDGFLEKKKEAILCYHSQFVAAGKEVFIESIMNENRYWGFQGRIKVAEPFFQKELPVYDSWPLGYR